MKVRDIEYDHSQLDCYGANDLYRKCHKELLEDFEATFKDFLDVELPELNEAQQMGIKTQKTGLLSAFVSGHLNAFNPASKFFVKFEVLTGNKEIKKEASPLDGLILPDHLKK